MEEIWKDINGYEGIYQISNLGDVRSLDHYTEQINNGIKVNTLYKGRKLKPVKIKSTGYLQVNIKGKLLKIHRLVAKTFLDNPNNLPCINHIDGNKQNNSVNNLEWCTHSDNMKHAHKIGLINLNTEKKKESELKNIKKAQYFNKLRRKKYE